MTHEAHDGVPMLVVDAEVVDPIDGPDAQRLDKRIRLLVQTIADNAAKLYELVELAKHGEIHKTLGFPSWTAYVADVFTVQIRLDREQRRELVGYLSGEGMSQRAIADVVGTDQATVSRDIARDADASPEAEPANITGLDGKTYNKSKPKQDRIKAPATWGRLTRKLRDVCRLAEECAYMIGDLTDEIEDEDLRSEMLDVLVDYSGDLQMAVEDVVTAIEERQ